jgi:hypothetical protein
VSGSGPADQAAPPKAVGSQQTPSPASRPAALRVTSGPAAIITGISPSSRQRICPVPEVYRSKPLIGSPANRAVAAQMKPCGGASSWRAVNGRHAPSRICPRIVSWTDDHSGVPAPTAWVSQRRAASGRPVTRSAANRPGGAPAVARGAHSARTGRAALGAFARSAVTRPAGRRLRPVAGAAPSGPPRSARASQPPRRRPARLAVPCGRSIGLRAGCTFPTTREESSACAPTNATRPGPS